VPFLRDGLAVEGLDASAGHCQLNGLRAPSSGPSRLEWGSILGAQRSSPT
jgi:hypothetical protein